MRVHAARHARAPARRSRHDGAALPSASAILIDLDGTLVDSAPDLRAAANRMLSDCGAPPLPAGTVRGFIGNGVPTLVQRVLAATPRCRTRARTWRWRHSPGITAIATDATARPIRVCCRDSPRWPAGLSARLRHQQAAGTHPAAAGHPGLSPYFSAVVSGDPAPATKPDPAPLLLPATGWECSLSNA